MKNWVKWLILVISIAIISIGLYFICDYYGITNIDTLRTIIERCGMWGWIVYILLFVIITNLLCFVPATSATFIVCAIILFGALNAFIISTISVFLSSSLMFLIGKLFGYKLALKLVGEKELNKARDLLDIKSKMFLPLMFLFPIFPDDALCLMSGITKMKYWYFALITIIFRTIGIATYCFLGSGFINWSELSIIDWFMLINICLIDIGLIFKYQPKLENWIKNKRNKGE